MLKNECAERKRICQFNWWEMCWCLRFWGGRIGCMNGVSNPPATRFRKSNSPILKGLKRICSGDCWWFFLEWILFQLVVICLLFSSSKIFYRAGCKGWPCWLSLYRSEGDRKDSWSCFGPKGKHLLFEQWLWMVNHCWGSTSKTFGMCCMVEPHPRYFLQVNWLTFLYYFRGSEAMMGMMRSRWCSDVSRRNSGQLAKWMRMAARIVLTADAGSGFTTRKTPKKKNDSGSKWLDLVLSRHVGPHVIKGSEVCKSSLFQPGPTSGWWKCCHDLRLENWTTKKTTAGDDSCQFKIQVT